MTPITSGVAAEPAAPGADPTGRLRARAVGLDEGEENEFKLNVPRPVATFEPEPRIEVKNARQAPGCEAAATRMMGYGDTHVGILSDAEALAGLSRVLDATTAAGKS